MGNNRYKTSNLHKIIFTISLFILLFIGAISFKHLENVSASSKMVVHTYEVNLKLEHLFSYIKDSENGMRGYLITNESIYLDPYYEANKKINETFSSLKELTEDNHEQQQNLNELYEIIKKRLDYNGEYSNPDLNINIGKNKKFKKDFNESSKLLVEIRDKINEMVELETSNLRERNSNYKQQIRLTPVLTLAILFITLILILYAYRKTTKDLEKLEIINNELSKSQFLSSQAEILSCFGTWEWNLNSQVIKYSDNMYRILGCEPQAFPATNDNFLTFVHPDDIEVVEIIMSRIIEEEDLPPSLFRIIKPDGKIRYFKATGKLHVDKLKNKTVLGVTTDITEDYNKTELLKNNIHDLKTTNSELELLDQSSKQAEILGNYGSWILNYQTLKFHYSDNKFRLLGHEPQTFDPSIENLLLHVHDEDKFIVAESNQKALTTGEIPTMEYRIIRKNGEIRRFKTSAKSFTDISGSESMIGTTQDVTEDYNKSKLLKERNLELEQNINELSEFNHVASHDLQEPLRKIQTFISRINDKEKNNLTDFGKDYIIRIEKASNRMRVLINDLLQYSRTNRSEKTFVNVNLNDVLANSLSELSQNIEDKKAIIENEKLDTIKGVDFQMQQLFTNLISNSLKYAKENVAPIIKIKGKKVKAKEEEFLKDNSSRNFYKVTFKDNGIGFDQVNAERIFQLFNRLHGKTEYEGTGVGLAICKKIVENHNGYIFANGKPDEGSKFTVYLPLN